jgi:hypothetical protein
VRTKSVKNATLKSSKPSRGEQNGPENDRLEREARLGASVRERATCDRAANERGVPLTNPLPHRATVPFFRRSAISTRHDRARARMYVLLPHRARAARAQRRRKGGIADLAR